MATKLDSVPLVNNAPGDNETLPAALAAVLDMHGKRTDKLIPAQVLQYDRAKNMATVQPMIMLVDMNDNTRMRNQIANIPVLSLGGGGFTINFPLKAGDFGWIFAADRDISLFVQDLKASPPNTFRSHSFSDSWFIPDIFRKYTIAAEDSTDMVIQSVDSGTRIAISNGEIRITAPSYVKVTTPKATFSQDVEILGKLTVQQMTYSNGGFSAIGTGGTPICTLPTNTTVGGINVSAHGHNGVQSGSSRTSDGMVS